MPQTLAFDFDVIENEARALQTTLWERQFVLWPGEIVERIDVCDPWVAAQFLGYEVQEGFLDHPGTRLGYALGGFLNRTAKHIGLSDRQTPRTQRFTLAHEIGHVLLHPGLHHHREMPLHGLTEPREPVDQKEREANHFAGCFLVPRKLLKEAFRKSFGVEHLRLTDDVAYDLLGDDFQALMNSPYGSLQFARVIAEARRFRRRQFGPLNELFKVSPTTLAIRLRQVGLISP